VAAGVRCAFFVAPGCHQYHNLKTQTTMDVVWACFLRDVACSRPRLAWWQVCSQWGRVFHEVVGVVGILATREGGSIDGGGGVTICHFTTWRQLRSLSYDTRCALKLMFASDTTRRFVPPSIIERRCADFKDPAHYRSFIRSLESRPISPRTGFEQTLSWT
jgi:hypothetical protein